MKHRVKFRIVQDSGSTGKIAINLKDGEAFPFSDTQLGIVSNDAPARTYFSLTVREMTTVLEGAPDATDLSVNGMATAGSMIRPGDLVMVAGKTIEFLEVPVPAPSEEKEDTQYLDISELRTPTATPLVMMSTGPRPALDAPEDMDLEMSAGRSLDAAVLAKASTLEAELDAAFSVDLEEKEEPTSEVDFKPAVSQESVSQASTRTLDPEPTPETEPEAEAEAVESQPQEEVAQEEYPAASEDADTDTESEESRRTPPPQDYFDPAKLEQSRRWKQDLDDSAIYEKKRDWRRKVGLGSIAAIFIGALVMFFSIGSKSTGPNTARLPASMPKAVEPAPLVQAQTAPDPDAQFNDVHRLINSAFIKHENRSIALENNGIAGQFSQQKIEFFSAVRYGKFATVKNMVESNIINPQTAMESDATALMQASYYNQVEIAKYLLSKKVDINDKDPSGATALMYAAQGNRLQIARYLLSRGANPLLQNREGHIALDIAKKAKYTPMVSLLRAAMSGRKIAATPPAKKKKKRRSR